MTFFQALNPYLPMTYAIGLLRNALLGVYWPTFFTGVYAMIAMIIATLLVTIIIKEKFDNVANKFEQIKRLRIILIPELYFFFFFKECSPKLIFDFSSNNFLA